MMNKWFFIVILFCGAYYPRIANAQEVIYSPYEKFDLRSGDYFVVGKVSGSLFTYRSGGEGHFLDMFDDSMNRVATVILDFFPAKIYETRLVAYDDRILVLYQALESGKIVQYGAILDAQGRLLKRPVALAHGRTGVFGQNREYFSTVVSEDKTKVLVYNITAKGSQLNFSGTWTDNQLEVRKKSQVVYEATQRIAAGSALLGNDGTLCLAAYTPTGSRDYADGLWLLTLTQDDRSFRSAAFALNDNFATGSYMKPDQLNNRIYIGGFYSEKKTGNYDGMLFGYYDLNTHSMQQQKLIPFDERLRNAAGERNARKAFNDYHVRNLIVKNDGGFVLIAESFYISSRNTAYAPGWGYYSMYSYGPFMAPAIREFFYGDILVISYNAEGQREWQSFIRKDQYSQEDGGVFSSFALLNTGGSLGFLFNDYNSVRSRIQLASVDGTGKIAMRSLAAGNNDDPDWLPRSGKQVAAREMVSPCLRKRQICFAKIIF